ncbi:MAG: uroporphyrinogen-III synthase [Halobacteria archaeon]|nr:uroporphyrinogen-III synthase [Halobacteria archaeon]
MRVAIFRPSGERERRSVELLESEGFDVVSDPLLEPGVTGARPLAGAGYIIFTSVTGVDIAVDNGFETDATVCAIGPKTRDALENKGVEVGVVPDDYTSLGLVKTLEDEVRGEKVEVARSDHGAPELLEGLNDAGAFVHETVLYELARPAEGGKKTVEGLLAGDIDAVLFTSSLTVEHLLEAAGDERNEVVNALSSAVVGTIGEPTRETAESHGIQVDFVPDEETFETLVEELKNRKEEVSSD